MKTKAPKAKPDSTAPVQKIVSADWEMSDESFVRKWNDGDESWWSRTASRVFWRRAYKMPPNQFKEMCEDYLSIEVLAENTQCCSFLAWSSR